MNTQAKIDHQKSVADKVLSKLELEFTQEQFNLLTALLKTRIRKLEELDDMNDVKEIYQQILKLLSK